MEEIHIVAESIIKVEPDELPGDVVESSLPEIEDDIKQVKEEVDQEFGDEEMDRWSFAKELASIKEETIEKEEEEDMQFRELNHGQEMLGDIVVSSLPIVEDDIKQEKEEVDQGFEEKMQQMAEPSSYADERLGRVVTSDNNEQEKKYCCGKCGASFSWLSALKRHKVTHTREKPYCCAECGVSLSDLNCLKRHKRTHTGEKPYRCAVCGASFSQSGALRKHTLTHTGERPYHCAMCGGSFNDLSNFKRHKQTHTGEKPFHCVECGAYFRQSGVLKRHKLTHR